MNHKRARALQTRLLQWYHGNKRDLPWRHTTHPYAIWVSEIMAQQTRITALLPYYERFMARFPDVYALAAADEQEVLKLWEGLGYYSRARNLKKAAERIVSEHGGQLPDNEKQLRALTGIGEYTAGAILSIAFGQPVPAVDGNVLRVHARVEYDETEIGTPQARQAAKQFVGACMPLEETGAFTQALMELGALACVPKTPLCAQCPLAGLCRAYSEGVQDALPRKAGKKPKTEKAITVLLLTDGAGRAAMRRREESLLHGMWEFVTVDQTLEKAHVAAFLSARGIRLKNICPAGENIHVFTHIIWHMRGFLCAVDSLAPLSGYTPVPRDEIKTLAIPAAFRMFADRLKTVDL